jgi:hypothetical protein
MATDGRLDERISRWLEAEAPGRLPDRALRATFERTRRTRQQGGWHVLLGRSHMPRSVLALGGAALVVVVAAVALSFYGNRTGVGGPASPSPSPTPSPTATVAVPSPSPTPEGLLPEGPHVLLNEGSVSMTVTIAAPDWYGPGSGLLAKGDAGMIVFAGEDLYVYGDPCHWSTTRPARPSTTVDAFVAAMSAQKSRDATTPGDVTVGEYAGKSITLHVPDDADFAKCDQGTFGSWGIASTDQSPFRYQQGPGQIDKLWVLDVDGKLVVIDIAYARGTPQTVIDELEAIVESATFK